MCSRPGPRPRCEWPATRSARSTTTRTREAQLLIFSTRLDEPPTEKQLVAVAVLAAAAPAAAQETVCRAPGTPKPPPTAAEKEQAELEHYAEQRAEFGFRHDLPYVKELIRRGVWVAP